jgi:hypothetical protein
MAENEAIHRNSYRGLFEAGALEPLMQFLARREIVQGQWESLRAGVTSQSKRCGIGEKLC